ncbi:hypothetical protein [Streptomyces sp. TRM49041]|uniref:hypothetical protein n=1 Tax=Streptomyces sp. TRM49041 TaxID=2603216 RepID=UPI0011ED5ABA|nr:hypothetical protein [Streptomyces sp. TRM49041]
MPFAAGEIYCGLACGPGPDGHWRGWIDVRVPPDGLRRLGLHPDQPTSRPGHPSPPGWWHADAERRARRQR